MHRRLFSDFLKVEMHLNFGGLFGQLNAALSDLLTDLESVLCFKTKKGAPTAFSNIN